MVVEIEKEWFAVNPLTDEIVAGGETEQEVKERVRDHLDLDPDDYDIVVSTVPRRALSASLTMDSESQTEIARWRGVTQCYPHGNQMPCRRCALED